MKSAVLFPLLLLLVAAGPRLAVTDVGAAYDAKHVEFRGVAAGAFDPRHWDVEASRLHFIPDVRSPLLAPRETGNFRNIYAPSVVRAGDGWHVYYGGWDGERTGNDRIYRVDADRDFLALPNRRTVIEHGDFQHVCNVSVTHAARGHGRGFAMACTAYPAADGLNKPVTFFSDDDRGEKWNADAARREHLVTIDGYDGFAAADINGMNVLLAEDGKYRLYFNNFRDAGKTFRASSDDARRFRFDRVVHEPSAIVNDVKRIDVTGGGTWYLMALHHNGPSLYHAMSRDGMRFGGMKTLATHGGDADRHIVAVGWVADGGRVLGFLYGAGDAPSLDRNRIFARWLQKKVSVGDAAEAKSLGPDRQLIPLASAATAAVALHDEHGALIATSDPVELKPGRAYRLDPPPAPAETRPMPSAAGREATPR